MNFNQIPGGTMDRKCWITASLAVLLLLTGCGTKPERKLENIEVGEYTYTDPVQDDDDTIGAETQNKDYIGTNTNVTEEAPTRPPAVHKKTTFLSMQGFYSSSNQQALSEWMAFRESYDVDKSILKASDQSESGIPVDYFAYGCYAWDMVNKVNEILDKYNLILLTNQELVQHDKPEPWLEELNIDGIFRENENINFAYAGGYFYSEGTFQIECSLRLTKEDAAWPYSVFPCYRYSVKACFDPAYLSVGDLDSYEQWEYIASDGNEMLLAMNSENAIIMCEQDEAFITVRMRSYSDPNSSERMGQQALEQIAETFDFSICPRT